MKEIVIRTISGVVFTALTLASLIIDPHNPYPFLLLFSFYLVRTSYEYLRLTMGKGQVAVKVFALIACVCIFVLGSIAVLTSPVFVIMHWVAIALLFLILFALPIAYLFSSGKCGFEYAWSSLVYIAVPFGLLFWLGGWNIWGFNGWNIASLLIIMWMGDIGAYCIGTAFGQGEHGHKLMPSVSPKKSWEGVFGAVVLSVGTALALRAFGVLMPDYSYWTSALFGLTICIFSILGDLVESKLKRKFQTKDAGRIMPGHGGLLDRFDSGLLAFPAAFLFYLILESFC